MNRKMGLRTEINIFITFALTIVVGFQALIFYYFAVAFIDQKNSLRESITVTFTDFIEQSIENVESRKNTIVQSSHLTQYILNPNDMLSKRELSNLVYTIPLLNNDTFHALAFDNNGTPLEISNNISNEEMGEVKKLYKEYVASGCFEKFSYFDFFNTPSNEYEEIYCLSFLPVYTHDFATASNRKVGSLCVFSQISTTSVYQGYDMVGGIKIELYSPTKKIKVIDRGNPEQTMFPLQIDDMQIRGTNWSFGGTVGYSTNNISWTKLFVLFLSESIMLIIVMIIFNLCIRLHMLKPLDAINKYMSDLRLSEIFKPLDVTGNADIANLSSNIMDMVLRNKKLANDVLTKQNNLFEAENLKKEAILYALQNQVNPHFMYNIFELIRSIACLSDIEEIETVAVSVSEILRYNLKSDMVVTVRDEYEMIEKYFAIMRVKYSDSFNVTCDLPVEVMETNVMKMLFQPIIENAFNHGYVRRKEGFEVRISGCINGGVLNLVFYDNGLGIDEEKLNTIRNNLSRKKYDSDRSIGIANLDYRLNMCYGENYELLIDSQAGIYTKIIVNIPLKNNSNQTVM